ncbi:acyltransferase family protein [Vibrio astriarenae]
MPELNHRRFEVLDSFRGISAICVVVFHLHFVGSFTEWSFFRGSYLFVEFFFVLSGFVLAHGYGMKEGLKFTPYIKARFYRIYPLHLTMLVVMFGFEIAKLLAHEFAGITFNDIPFTGSNHPIQLIPDLLLIQSWFPATANGSFNYPAWSISIEFYLYIILFVTISLCKQQRTLLWASISLATLALLTLFPQSPHRVPLTGLTCFFGGASIYMLYQQLHAIKVSYVVATLLECLALLAIIALVQSDPFTYRMQLAIVLFLAAVLLFAFEQGAVSQLLKHRPFLRLGELSYSIYMIHVALIFVFTSVFIVFNRKFILDIAPTINGQRYITLGDDHINNLVALLLVVTITICARWSHKHIELRGQRLGKSQPIQSTTQPKTPRQNQI